MENKNQLAESRLEETKAEYERDWYTIEESRAITHKKIEEHYASLRRQAGK